MERTASAHSSGRRGQGRELRAVLSVGIVFALLAVISWLAARRILAEGEPKKEKSEPQAISLEVWGKLGKAVKGAEAFLELASYGTDAKGRRTTEKILIEIAESTELYADSAIRIEDLKSGDEIWLFGKAFQREVLSKRGAKDRRGTDRVIQAVRAILAGEGLSVNQSFADPKDPAFRWLKAAVSDSSAGLRVRYQGQEYRVTLEKDAAVLRRSDCPRKALKSGVYVQAVGEKTNPPESESAAKGKSETKLAIRCKRIAILDARYITSAYALIVR